MFQEERQESLSLAWFPPPYVRHSVQGNCLELEASEDGCGCRKFCSGDSLSDSVAGVMVSGVSTIDDKGRIQKKKTTKNLERRKAEMAVRTTFLFHTQNSFL